MFKSYNLIIKVFCDDCLPNFIIMAPLQRELGCFENKKLPKTLRQIELDDAPSIAEINVNNETSIL